MRVLLRVGTVAVILILQVTTVVAANVPRQNEKASRSEADRFVAKLEKAFDVRTSEGAWELSQLLNDAAGTDRGHVLDAKTRSFRVQLMLRGLEAVRKKIDPKFDKNDVPAMNIAPGGPYTAGIVPEAIKEPEIRRKYEAAIQLNRVKAERYSLQTQLGKIREQFPKRVVPFLHLRYDETLPADGQELNELLKQEIQDNQLRQELLDELTQFRKDHLPHSLGRRAN